MTSPSRTDSAPLSEAIRALKERTAEVERDRDRLLVLTTLYEDLSRSLHFVDILQAVAGRLGSAFALDRCSVFLTGEDGGLRLVSSFEDPKLRNLTVDPARYPELQRAMESGETVYIPDAASEPLLRPVWKQLVDRKVQSILVVPMKWEGRAIGALFLRTVRGTPPLDDGDVAFCQRVTAMTAQALHHSLRLESVDAAVAPQVTRETEAQRLALLAFVQRLLERAGADGAFGGVSLPRTTSDELDRLVEVAFRVLSEQQPGG